MSKYLVKALMSRQGGSSSIRFVPLEIFDLWKSHMKNTYDCQITAVEISLWVAAEPSAGNEPEGRQRPHSEPVIEVTLRKKVGAALMPIERFVSRDEIGRVLPKLLLHYGLPPAAASTPDVSLRGGFFLAPGDIFDDV